MNQQIATADQSLKMTRLIWFALIMGQVVFLTIVGLFAMEKVGSSDAPSDIIFYVNLAMLFIAVPVGLFVRQQVYKKHWVEDRVEPGGYFVGNLIFLACCEGVALLGIVNTMLAGEFGLPILPTVIALAIQALNFPNGRPMQGRDFTMSNES